MAARSDDMKRNNAVYEGPGPSYFDATREAVNILNTGNVADIEALAAKLDAQQSLVDQAQELNMGYEPANGIYIGLTREGTDWNWVPNPEVEDALEKLLGVAEAPSEQEAASIDSLVEEHVLLKSRIAEIEEQLADAKKRVAEIEGKLLVDAMHSAQRQELVTECDLTRPFPIPAMELKLFDQLLATLPKRDDGKRHTTINYVRDNGGADIIKNVITVPVKGHNEATLVKGWLCEQNLPFKEDEDIHPGTFNKFLREKLERDHELDFDKANAYLQTVVEVKPFIDTKKVKVGRKR